MATRKTVDIYGLKVVLQTVSVPAYFEAADRYGITSNGRRDTNGYNDWLFKNIVISPRELAIEGVSYFEDDLASVLKLSKEIDTFLGDPPKRASDGDGTPQGES